MRDLQPILQHLFNPRWQRWVRFDIEGMEHYPRTGAAILAGNHRSYFDFFVLAQLVRLGGRSIRMMAKQELFDVPVLGAICHGMGGIPVDRHSANATEAYAAAIDRLRAGELVGMMPQGTIPRGEAFFDPVLKGKTGVARLAAATGAPVVPFGLWGTDVLWPRSAKAPKISRWRDPVTVRVRIGPALHIAPVSGAESPGTTAAIGNNAGTSEDGTAGTTAAIGNNAGNPVAETARVMAAIMALLPPEAGVRHTPTELEIRATHPDRPAAGTPLA